MAANETSTAETDLTATMETDLTATTETDLMNLTDSFVVTDLMDMDIDCTSVQLVDSMKALTKVGIRNICNLFGSIKKINFREHLKENISYVEFEDKLAAHKLMKEKSILPSYLTVNLIYNKEKVCVKNSEVIQNPKTINIQYEESIRESVYLGPNISMISLIEESKQLKLNSKIVSYNLDNDNLFGMPLTSKWKKFEKFDFELNNISFSKRFENYFGGEIKIEKKLGPNINTGWVTIFNDGENVKTTLKCISDDIECSDVLNVDNLKQGMLVGAFDTVTNLYGRGYVALISGNSVNVAMIDYGRVINTTIIRVLPEKHTQTSAYSFRVYTKDQCASQLKEKTYTFKVRFASSERVVLIIFDENKEIKVQLKIWQPSVEEFGVPYVDFKSGNSVELLKLKDMNSVYLKSKESRLVEFLFFSWNILELYCSKTKKFLNREPLYGEIIGFKSTKSKNHARGRIHKYLGNDTYCVKHMDNPFKENIKLSEMIELQFEHKIIPVSFIKVGLKRALPYPIQFQAEQFVKLMTGVKLLVEYDKSNLDGWKCVDLEIKVVKENLNSILFGLVEPSWLKDVKINPADSILRNPNNFCDYSDILKTTLKENSVYNMKFVMYHDKVFYMRDQTFGKSFILLSDMIKEYCCIELHPYLPHQDELCLGLFPDGMWYRIACDKLTPGELTQVHSVDTGNVAFLDSKNMKKFPIDLLFHPSHVYRCILDTPKQVNENKLKLLEEYENSDCEFTVVEHLESNYYFIKCSLIENILV